MVDEDHQQQQRSPSRLQEPQQQQLELSESTLLLPWPPPPPREYEGVDKEVGKCRGFDGCGEKQRGSEQRGAGWEHVGAELGGLAAAWRVGSRKLLDDV